VACLVPALPRAVPPLVAVARRSVKRSGQPEELLLRSRRWQVYHAMSTLHRPLGTTSRGAYAARRGIGYTGIMIAWAVGLQGIALLKSSLRGERHGLSDDLCRQ